MARDWTRPNNRQPVANNFVKPAFTFRLVSIVWTPGRTPGLERCVFDNWIGLFEKFVIVGADRGDEEIMIRSFMNSAADATTSGSLGQTSITTSKRRRDKADKS
jgi:hypothetical protein